MAYYNSITLITWHWHWFRAHFLSLTQNKLSLCSANHRAGYFSNLTCDWLSIVWDYSQQETENGPRWGFSDLIELTPKHREPHGCVVSTVATDAPVLKHQAISIQNADYIFILFDQFHIKILHLWWTALENKIKFWKKMTQLFKG